MPNKPRDQDPSEKSWYYLLDDETLGPVPGAQLRRLLQSGELGPDTLVWCQGMKDWVPARSFKAGAAQRPLAPPPRAQAPAPDPGHTSTRLRRSGRRESEDTPPASSHRSARRLPWAVAGALAAMAILMCGVGIGYVLRQPAEDTGRESRATPGQSGDASAQVVQRSPEATRRPAPAAGARSASPASASRDPATGSDDSGSMPAVRAVSPRDEPSRSAADAAAPVAAPANAAGRPGIDTGPATAGETTTLYHIVDFHCRSSSGVEGIATTQQERRFQILTRLTIGARQPDKSCQVKQTVEQVRLGTADELSRATYEAELNKLVGQQYSFTLNERDEITEFTGFQSTTTNAPIANQAETGLLVATVIDEDGWQELMQRSFLRPPDTAAGQIWRGSVNHHWGPLGYWRGVTTYTPRGPEGYGLRYDFTHEMSYVPPGPSASVLGLNVAGAEFQPVQSDGYFVFDAQRGHVISVHEIFHVRGAVATELMGSTVRLQIEEYQEFVVEISNENPWQQ